MLRLFARSAPAVRNAFSARASYTIVNQRNMAAASFDRSKLFDVSHVTAVVTGGATGIGLMITQALATNGAKVYIVGRRQEVLEKTVETYDSGSGQIIALPGDVSSKSEVQRLASEVSKKEPNGIQLLVNNAGVARDDPTKLSGRGQPLDFADPVAVSEHFLASQPESWDETFRINAASIYFASMAFLPLLAKGGKAVPDYSSSVVNVSSISGCMKGSSGGQFAYAASKAAATHVSRMLATTFVKTGVRVNTIAPGMFPSEMTTGASDEKNKSKLTTQASNPSGRYGNDSDMAATILFLAGHGGTFYNEQIVYPDGGNTLVQPSTN
ncbi:short chain dehydrogenase reductase [Diplodia corticola]|uniref:Short chain dehydrogenase reductase n=1 Tax=Diplodia corticola TaxID=236234 RepID=A0A1J9RNY7_9PEZI|nr:short chain dehydrogenase reductase [Diplodia corticola]OJD29285.1 short chain dehydrogenase reductase [Diplodia corticola]